MIPHQLLRSLTDVTVHVTKDQTSVQCVKRRHWPSQNPPLFYWSVNQKRMTSHRQLPSHIASLFHLS